MKNVNAFFYFKDDTVLEVFSEKGIYNNKTLDMNFSKNVKAIYEGITLTSEKAEYSNSNNFLQISGSVKVDDVRGNFTAEKLYFDISEQTLNTTNLSNQTISFGSTSFVSYNIRQYDNRDIYDDYSNNDEFELEADEIIDFAETNPFGTY